MVLDHPRSSSTLSAPSQAVPIAVAPGDGIGPEIMEATLRILQSAGAKILPQPIQIGEEFYRNGYSTGITPEAWKSIRDCRVLLKAPITTPQGNGVKSLNVTLRKSLGLFANVRPTVAYTPFVPSAHPEMDVVVVRENEEDLYAGIEHRQTDQVFQCLKLITRPGCERICRYAFEFARTHGRRKVTCMTKDNIMKLTDGLFHDVFEEIGSEYPEIERDHWIVDIGIARAATRPETFDVIVTPNLYGDILSDVTAELAGSVGLAPSANIGADCAMFEAIHGSAPDIAGRGIANPSGLILASVMMLVHIGQPEVAGRIHNALLSTLEEGIHTLDLVSREHTRRQVGTSEFASAVIERLGEKPKVLRAVEYGLPVQTGAYLAKSEQPEAVKELVGVDVFVQWAGDANQLSSVLEKVASENLKLQMITNRGVKVWPGGFPETLLSDHWRCRFNSEPMTPVASRCVADLIQAVIANGMDFIKCEGLFTFDGKPGFSMGQGQ